MGKAELQAKLNAIKASKGGGKKNTSKVNKENKKPKEKSPKKSRNAASVRWAQEESHYLTDELITLIEESNLYRESFGFKKVTSEPVPTGGRFWEYHATLPDTVAMGILFAFIDSTPHLRGMIANHPTEPPTPMWGDYKIRTHNRVFHLRSVGSDAEVAEAAEFSFGSFRHHCRNGVEMAILKDPIENRRRRQEGGGGEAEAAEFEAGPRGGHGGATEEKELNDMVLSKTYEALKEKAEKEKCRTQRRRSEP
ncbi:hypothetical protein B0H13DRAFT_1930457 [Mycena leptocephala]|nr:hypothetical protein B0H13DRAFT_1930457 [Mycena leptocephala]